MPLNCFYAPITSAIFEINKSKIEIIQIKMLQPKKGLKQSKFADYCRVYSIILAFNNKASNDRNKIFANYSIYSYLMQERM